MRDSEIKLNDVVWFQAYPDNKPVQGKVVNIGTQTELGIGWDETDDRVFYALETLDKVISSRDRISNFQPRKIIFTRTTARWLFKEEPNFVEYI